MKFNSNLCHCLKGVVTYRFGICALMFTSCWIGYMLKVNISLNIIDMVVRQHNGNSSSSTSSEPVCRRPILAPSADDNTTSIPVLEDQSDEDRFNWSGNIQGLILGSYFWGYTITSMPGGVLAERFGPRMVVGLSTVASGLLTALCPVAARAHYGVLLALRFLLGACGGVLFPALHCLISRWAPPAEKGRFVAALMGGTLGTVVTWALCGTLLKTSGWPSGFYVPAAITIVWSVLWMVFVSDTPDENRFISEDEKRFIMASLDTIAPKKKTLPPFKDIFTSVPFMAMVVLHFGNMWGIYFLMTAGPSFLAKVLGFNLQAAGILSGLPYLSRLVFAFVFGFIGDAIKARTTLSTTLTRKCFVLFSHVIPGALLVALAYSGCDPLVSLTLITASLGMNGAATITNLQNHQDLAPNFAGTLYGIANTVGSVAGFVTPSVTAYFTRNGNGFAEWRSIFIVGASAYFLSAAVFILLGSGVRQLWNEPKKPPPDSEDQGVDNKGLEIEKF